MQWTALIEGGDGVGFRVSERRCSSKDCMFVGVASNHVSVTCWLMNDDWLVTWFGWLCCGVVGGHRRTETE